MKAQRFGWLAIGVAPLIAGALISTPALAATARSHYRFLEYGVPGAAGTAVTGINRFGMLAGEAIDSAGGNHGFLAAGTRITRFDVPGTSGVTLVSGFNNASTIAAGCTPPARASTTVLCA